MKKKLVFVWIFLIIFCLTGCLPRSLEPHCEKILIMPNNPYVCKECRFIHNISGKNIHGEMTAFTSEKNLLIDDINYLKNAAAKLNANVVVYKQHTIVQVPHWSPAANQHFYNDITHNIEAEAYVCSENEKRQISNKNIDKNRDY